MKLSILIPVYNEKDTILEILRRIQTVNLSMEKEIIIVDDYSRDGTRDILKSLDQKQYKVILKTQNEGKGAAIKTGLSEATGDFVIFQDADLEYDPQDYPALIAPLQDSSLDMVIGSRVLSGSMNLFGPRRAHLGSYLGCKIIAASINFLYGRSFTDYYGCYKIIRRGVLNSVPVEANGFEYDSELLCKLLKKKIKATEVGIQYYPRARSEGKKLSFVKDGFRVLCSIFYWRLFDR